MEESFLGQQQHPASATDIEPETPSFSRRREKSHPRVAACVSNQTLVKSEWKYK
jgi:hypothetical protein